MLRKKKRSPQTSVVGLELDAGHVAAAEVSVDGTLTLTRGAVAELRPGIMRDGEVADPIALAEAVKALFAENELPKTRSASASRISASSSARSTSRSSLDDPKALAAAVRGRRSGPHPDADGRGGPGLPVARRRQHAARPALARRRRRRPPEMVERAAAALEGAGLELEGIDLSAFGMVRALASEHEGAVLYINVAGLVERRRRQRQRLPVHARVRGRRRDDRDRRSPSAAGSRSSTRGRG